MGAGRKPGGGVGEVEAAGAVEGFFERSGELAAGQDAVLVVVVAGAVDRETPEAGVPGIAGPAEWDGCAGCPWRRRSLGCEPVNQPGVGVLT